MKTFRYNGVEYTLYRAGERNGSPYPCIAARAGNCPARHQRPILRELLRANGIEPDPGGTTHQYVAQAFALPETAVSEVRGPAIGETAIPAEDLVRFKKLLEWFVKQQRINAGIVPGRAVSGQGYKGHKIRSHYSEWREYGGFTLDVTLQCGYNVGTAANYIHATASRVNVTADYAQDEAGRYDVVALKICVNAKADGRTYPAVSVRELGLFDGREPNGVLKKFFEDYVKEIDRSGGASEEELPSAEAQEAHMEYPLNQILYGPPGTGKTYGTISHALAIMKGVPVEAVERQMEEDRGEVLRQFRNFLQSGRIAFTTFHQSMGYEEFIEGIKPETDDAGSVRYAVRPGIFKSFCSKAMVLRSNLTAEGCFFRGSPTVWKVSLAGTGKNPVRQECMENEHIRIGWDEYGETVTDETDYSYGGKYILDAFMNTMQRGDVVLSCFSANTVDAIGVVTGDYEWHGEYDHYKRVRKVKWLVKNINADITQYNGGKQMTLSTIYKMNVSAEDVVKLLNTYAGGNSEAHYEYPGRYVFIIDEINRGNISKIFGELITLLEESKRLGNAEETKCILPYSGEAFGVPKNVYILGTMNTADRSLVQLDAALRRRFSFIEKMPDADRIPVRFVEGVDIRRMLETVNDRIEALVDREHRIGHAYFISLGENAKIGDLAEIFRSKIIPLLQEYFYDDYAAIGEVLSGAFIEERTVELRSDSKTVFRPVVPETAEAYRSIYE